MTYLFDNYDPFYKSIIYHHNTQTICFAFEEIIQISCNSYLRASKNVISAEPKHR
jgi:hypothetical protein